MHLLAEETITVACSVDTAYRYAANLENFGDWFPAVLSIEPGNALDHATPGKQYLETVSVPFRGERKVLLTVTDAAPGRHLVTQGSLRPLLPQMELAFTDLGADSCRITWRMFSRSRGTAPRITIVPLARRVMRRRAAVGMSRLKQRLE